MKLEIERRSYVLVWVLLERELNIKSDALASGFVGAEVGGFHDSGTSAGGDHEAVSAGGNLGRPLGQHVRELAGVLVVARHVDSSLGAL